MPAPLSVIIPTLNAADQLPATAEALLEGVSSGLVSELVISDGGSSDATKLVADELGALWVEGAAGRGGQIKRGIDASEGKWLLLLHADTQLSPGWAEVAHGHMTSASTKAGWFKLRFRARGFMPQMVAAGANLRSRVFDLPYGDQGLLIARDTLNSVGGMPILPLMEDVALAKALKGRLVQLDAEALTSAERYQRDGWGTRIFSNLGTLARYKLGADPNDLKRRYERQKSSP